MIKLTVNQLLLIDPQILIGKIICFPTDTVYGVATMIKGPIKLVELGYQKIYQLKNRQIDKALPILLSSPDQLTDLVSDITSDGQRLMALWPNALTLIFKRHPQLPSFITGDKPTIAIRIPNSDIALTVLNHLGPCATTSINISGQLPLNDPEQISDQFSDQLDYLIVDQCQLSEISSTIVDLTNNNFIIRQGTLKV